MGKRRVKGRFSQESTAHFSRRLFTGIVLLAAVPLLFSQAVDALSDRAGAEQKKNLEDAVWRGITQCYAMEGRYPQSMEYLKQEYGIQYDSQQFFVDYQALGANILPDVTVIEKK